MHVLIMVYLEALYACIYICYAKVWIKDTVNSSLHLYMYVQWYKPGFVTYASTSEPGEHIPFLLSEGVEWRRPVTNG